MVIIQTLDTPDLSSENFAKKLSYRLNLKPN